MSERQQDPRQPHADAATLRKRTEEQASLSAHTPDEIKGVLHELLVHQIELEVQNEELRTAQSQIEAGRARYLDLYDLAPVGYCTISEKGIILETNLTLTTMLGVNRQKLIKKPFSAFILREDQGIYYLLQKESFDTGKPQTCEFSMVRSDKTTFWAFLQATALKDEDGTKSVRVAISDFSKQKIAEQKLRLSEAENRAIIELIPDMIFHLGKDGQYLDVKNSSDRQQALPKEDLLKKNIKDMFTSEVATLMLTAIRKAITSNDLQVLEYELAIPAGMRIFEVRIQKLTDDEVLAFVRDITERKQMEHQLFKEKEQFRTTLLSVGDGVISTDVQGNILIMNKTSEQLTGWTQEEATGKPMDEVFYIINEFTREKCENPVQKALEKGDAIELANHAILISRDGTERPIEDSTAPIKDEQGNIIGVVLVFRDFSEKKKSQDEIKYASLHDHLTELYNRKYFEEELKRLDTERNWPLMMVMGDVNGLKLFNDSFGHDTGDNLLVRAAKAIRKCCRADDIIARIGGDEFVILLPKTDTFEAEQLIKRIKDHLKKEKVENIEISISFGYASKRIKTDEIGVIFKKAEDMMYHNKLFEGPSIRGKVIDSIVDALHKKSKREQAHSKRVSELCERMGIALELNEHKTKELTVLGLLHDIGKIAISDDMLNKPAELTVGEWIEMKRHSEIGYRILSTANDMSEITEYVLAHHERWDGQGYPKGLKGEAIPLESRICSIADAYDAMTSKRNYSSSLTKDAALAELKNNAGTQFDPELIRVFVDMLLCENGQ